MCTFLLLLAVVCLELGAYSFKIYITLEKSMEKYCIIKETANAKLRLCSLSFQSYLLYLLISSLGNMH